MDEQSTECGAVLHSVDIPAMLAYGSQELVPGQPDISGAGSGEEIQILRWTCRHPLRQ
jgi:hypothetical protein